MVDFASSKKLNLKWLVFKIYAKLVLKNQLFSKEQKSKIIAQMDQGNFNFDPKTEKKMMAQWHLDNTKCPYPTKLIQAYQSKNAIKMNSTDLMELTYQLPYGKAYEEFQHEKYARLIRWASKRGAQLNHKVVADFGCGYGGLLQAVKDLSNPSQLIGIECAHSAIEWMKINRPFVRGIYGNLQTSNQLDFKADVIFCTEVLEHLLYPSLGLAKLLACLNPGGSLILTVPEGRTDHAAQHINFWSPESWKVFLEENLPNVEIVTDVEYSENDNYNLAIIKTN